MRSSKSWIVGILASCALGGVSFALLALAVGGGADDAEVARPAGSSASVSESVEGDDERPAASQPVAIPVTTSSNGGPPPLLDIFSADDPGAIDLDPSLASVAGLAPGNGIPLGVLRSLGAVDGAAEAGADALGGVGGESGEPSGDEPPRGLPHRGLVVDAVDGRPISGARLTLVAFHGSEAPGGAGLPPLDVAVASSDADGAFVYSPPWPADPRLRLHVHASHEGYAPLSCVLVDRESPDGAWTRVSTTADTVDPPRLEGSNESGEVVFRLPLRAVVTSRVRILAPEGPLAEAPVRATPWRDAASLLEAPQVEVAADWRLVREGEPRVLWTDDEGGIDLPFSDRPWRLELLDPLWHLEARGLVGVPQAPSSERAISRRAVTVLLPLGGELALSARSIVRQRRLLVDREGRALPSTELEVELEGLSPVRTVTDELGAFVIDIPPFPPLSPPLGIGNPRRGEVRVLSPELEGHTTTADFPDVDARIEIEALASPLLVVRLREPIEEETASADERKADARAPTRPLPARGLETSLDMTLVHASAEGVVVLRGALPPEGTAARFVVAGRLPGDVIVPATRDGVRYLHLGDLALAKGLEREVRLRGVEPSRLRGARLIVSPTDDDRRLGELLAAQRFPVPPGGDIVVSGLWRGDVLLSVDGPWIEPSSRVVTIRLEELDEPLHLDVGANGSEDVTVAGRVRGLTPLVAATWQVIERIHRVGLAEPLVVGPYPLGPDGELGGRRVVSGARAVEVIALSPTSRQARDTARRADGPPVFVVDELVARKGPRAELAFEVTGLGPVLPPGRVAIEGPDGASVTARFRALDGRLLVDHLGRGRHVLRWSVGDGDSQAWAFDVDAARGGVVEGVIERAPLASEVLIVELVDSSGLPVAAGGAPSLDGLLAGRSAFAEALRRAREPVADGSADEPTEPDEDRWPGLQDAPARGEAEERGIAVTVRPSETTRFRVEPTGFLPVRVEVPPREPVPRRITVYRGVAARGRLLDSAGDPAEGILEVSWEPERVEPVRHGGPEPLEAEVHRGRFEIEGLPPLPLRFTFRLSGSRVAVTRRLALAEDADEIHDLGTIRLEETRVLRGVVRYVDGAPAASTRVALVPRERAWTYPLREPFDLDRVEHRTSTDAAGEFLLEGLPVELEGGLALVARSPDGAQAVLWPIDVDAESLELVLDEPARLELAVGYRAQVDFDRYEFTLEYQEDPADPVTRIDLGEIPPDRWGATLHAGVRPGAYRVKWRLRDAYEPIPGLVEEVWVPPGGEGTLRLVIVGDVLQGRARFNGEPVERGWVLVTYDPGVSGGTRVGRIVDGAFELIDPPDSFRAWVAVIPEASPQPIQNTRRGEALPQPIVDWRGVRRAGWLDVDYRARSLTLRFDASFLEAHPDAVLHRDDWIWDGQRFRPDEAIETIQAPDVTFLLLEERVHSFTIRNARGTPLRRLTVPLRGEDLVVRIR